MITQLDLGDWKSYQEATLQIDSLTVVIGTNASGKSNALDALAFLNRIATGAMLTSALQGDGALPALRGGVEWAARKPGTRFWIGVKCKVDELTDYYYRLECRVSESRCDVSAESIDRIRYRPGKDATRKSEAGRIKIFRTDACTDEAPTIVARLYNEKQGTRRELGRAQPLLVQLVGQKLRQEIQDGISVVVESLRDIFILDPIPSHMRGYSPLAEKLDSDARNIAGVIAALAPQKQKEIESVLTSYVSKLPERDIRRVYAETVGKFGSSGLFVGGFRPS